VNSSDAGPSVSAASVDARIPILYLLTDEISSVLVRGQLGYLHEHGFNVTVAARRADPDDPPEPGKWDHGVTVEHVPFVREPSPIADLRALWATIRLIRVIRPTIVNASTPKAGLLGSGAAWLCRVPVRVYVVRGFRFETATGWRRRLFRSLEWLAIRCANHVIFNSRSLMAVGEAEGVIRPGRGEVIGAGSGNGIDVSRFADDQLPTREAARAQFGLPEDADVVGFVGRFTKDKGIEDLVEVFETLPADAARQPDNGEPASLWLLLVGQFEAGDPVTANTRRTIEQHERIVVVPWLERTGVAYRAMDVLAFPSYREGLPNVPLEAQLCGIPVVGYAATGSVDAVDAGGRLVRVGDAAGLTAALDGLLSDPGEAERLGSAGYRQVRERFARELVWSALAQRLTRACAASLT